MHSLQLVMEPQTLHYVLLVITTIFHLREMGAVEKRFRVIVQSLEYKFHSDGDGETVQPPERR